MNGTLDLDRWMARVDAMRINALHPDPRNQHLIASSAYFVWMYRIASQPSAKMSTSGGQPHS